MRLWVTRTRPGADKTAARLAGLGHQAVIEPVLAHFPIEGADGDPRDAAAIAFSSPNAVAAFAGLSARRDLPVFATGEATAKAARDVGFANARSAGGGLEDLAALIAAEMPAGSVFWPTAAEPAGDLGNLLAAHGVAVVRRTVYETREARWTWPVGIEAVLVASPKAARLIAARAEAASLALPVMAISEKAAAPLQAAGFIDVRVASRPDETGLFALIRP